MPKPSVAEELSRAAAELERAGIVDPTNDAELLLAHILNVSRGEVQTARFTGRALDADSAARLRSLTTRRAAREPLQHITGQAYFRHLTLDVGPGVFVPRPETELLAQIAIDRLRSVPTAQPLAVDLGAGSGAIGLALATEVTHARVVAVEKSPDAITWTRRNADRSRATNYEVRPGDLTTALADLDGTVDVIASNPPYVPDDAVPRDPEVRLYDPAMALYGGPDGLDIVRSLSLTGRRLGRPGALIAIEHGELQGEGVREILRADGWVSAATHRDLTLRDRVTTAHAPIPQRSGRAT